MRPYTPPSAPQTSAVRHASALKVLFAVVISGLIVGAIMTPVVNMLLRSGGYSFEQSSISQQITTASINLTLVAVIGGGLTVVLLNMFNGYVRYSAAVLAYVAAYAPLYFSIGGKIVFAGSDQMRLILVAGIFAITAVIILLTKASSVNAQQLPVLGWLPIYAAASVALSCGYVFVDARSDPDPSDKKGAIAAPGASRGDTPRASSLGKDQAAAFMPKQFAKITGATLKASSPIRKPAADGYTEGIIESQGTYLYRTGDYEGSIQIQTFTSHDKMIKYRVLPTQYLEVRDDWQSFSGAWISTDSRERSSLNYEMQSEAGRTRFMLSYTPYQRPAPDVAHTAARIDAERDQALRILQALDASVHGS